MTIEEARKELDALQINHACFTDGEFHSLVRVVKLMWDHLDGRGVLSGEPWAGMRFDKTDEEVK
jgi:hypothetical protein